LSGNFLFLVGIAFLPAIPLSWYGVHRWLENFAYKIEISWQVFALAGLLTGVVAFLTVGFHSLKAAMANPVKSLRAE
jgi:putative ABC transport system permease protein